MPLVEQNGSRAVLLLGPLQGFEGEDFHFLIVSVADDFCLMLDW